MSFNPSALGTPIKGPGKWVQDALAHRSGRVAECSALGEVRYERVQPSGYAGIIERCTRCKRLKRHHK
jgi:hypothetical protein